MKENIDWFIVLLCVAMVCVTAYEIAEMFAK